MKIVLHAALWIALLVLPACEVRESTAELTPRRDPIRSMDLVDLQVGKTSPAQIEQQFGPPDERRQDGALVYRWTNERGRGSITFQFAGGALSQLCRERS